MSNHIKDALFAPVNKAFNTTVGSFVMEDEHMYLVVEEDNYKSNNRFNSHWPR